MKNKFIVLFCFLSSLCNAQSFNTLGRPFIQNYTQKDFNGSNQIWSLMQDNRGVMFFGNPYTIAIFDGSEWKSITNSNSSCIRSITKDKNGIIYIGGIGDLGFLSCNEKGQYNYVSLVNLIPEKHKQFNDVWKTACFNDRIYFFTFKKVYIYDKKRIVVNELDFKPFFGYEIKGNLYSTIKEKGTVKWLDTSYTILPHTKELSQKRGLEFITDFGDDKILIYDPAIGLQTYDLSLLPKNTNKYDESLISKDILKHFDNEVEPFLSKNIPYTICQVSDSIFAFGTRFGGVLLMNKKGKIVQTINKKSGILSDAILSLYIDNFKNLWVGTEDGISYVELNSPLTLFDEVNGISGYLSNIYSINNIIYVVGVQGISYLKDYNLKTTGNYSYRKIAKNQLSCFCISNFNNTLLTSNCDLIKDTNLIDNPKKPGVYYKIVSSVKFPDNLFYVASSGAGILSAEVNSKKLNILKISEIPEVNVTSRNVEVDQNGNLWICTERNGVKYLKFIENKINKYRIFTIDTIILPHTRINNIVFFDNKKYLTTDKGLFEITFPVEGCDTIFKLIHSNLLGQAFSSQENSLSKFIRSTNNNFYIISNGKALELKISKNDSIIYNYLPFKNISSVVTSIKEIDNSIWLTTENGLYQYDLIKHTQLQKPYLTIIKKVTIGRDSVLLDGTNFVTFDKPEKKINSYTCSQSENHIPNILFKYKSIAFYFSAVYFNSPDSIKYQYKLDGFDENWSDWTREKKKEYTNLSPGIYLFKVKARNLYEVESAETVYRFVILKPWYVTTFAYIVYLILIVGLVYLIVKFNTHRLKQANFRLEKMVKERTKEIVRQKEEILVKNEEILAQNEEILAQNEEIRTQKDELEIHRSNLEKLVDERTFELRIAKEKAEESDSLKTSFLNNMSHEIRTPLNAILGFSNLLINEQDEQEKNELIDSIVQNSNTLIQLIEDIIDISKIETGQLNIDIVPSDINAIVERLSEKFRDKKNQLNKKNVEINYSIGIVDEEFKILTDPLRLVQILSNLLDNALKFTEKGVIQFGYVRDNSQIKFFVMDTGVGLTEKQKEVMFMRFIKTSNSNEKLYQGIGLGLSICKSLVGMLGGDIWVESEVNAGSTFYFTIPYLVESSS